MGAFARLASALLLAGCAAAAPDPIPAIAGVRVETDLTALDTRRAIVHWQRLSDDLNRAIAARFPGVTDPDGPTIRVDIDEAALDAFFADGAVAETARLSGLVELIDPAGAVVARRYVSVAGAGAAEFLPAGTDPATVDPASSDYYQAVVLAFAKAAAEAVRAGT